MFVRLDIQERDDKKHLENPGGDAVMAMFGGKDQGLPFIVMMNPDKKVLADSKMLYPGKKVKQNMGFPAAPEEIANFIAMLKVAAPRMTTADLERIRTKLSEKPL